MIRIKPKKKKKKKKKHPSVVNMYAATAAARARDAAKPKPKKISPLTTILPICCLLFIAFLTAVVIVLALIPLYLPRKDVTITTPTYLAIMEYEGAIGPDGYLENDARNAFARAIEKELKLKEGSIDIKKGTVSTTPDSRTRRTPFVLRHRFHRGIRDPLGIQRIYVEYQLFLEKCGLICRSPEFIRRLRPVTFTVTFKYNGRTFTIVVTIYFQSNTKYKVPVLFNPDNPNPNPATVPSTGNEGTVEVTNTDGEILTTPEPLSTSTPAMVTLDLVP